jgi:hypothetical protein
MSNSTGDALSAGRACDCGVKLYEWSPSGHGDWSLFVAAHSRAEAHAAVIRYIDENHAGNSECDWVRDPDVEPTVHNVGEATFNCND